MINISNPQQQLRQNRAMLLLIGGVSSFTGLMLWSATPFAASNPKNTVHVCIRYIALFSSLSCGVAAVATGYQLEKINPLIKALDMAEKDDFLTQLAASQWVQQQQWEKRASQALQPTSQPPVSVQQDTPSQSTSQLTDPTSDAGSPDIEGYRALFQSVSLAKSQGATDTQIIEKVLGLGGRNFNQGKVALQALLQMGNEQGW